MPLNFVHEPGENVTGMQEVKRTTMLLCAENTGHWFTVYGQALVLYARQWLSAELAEEAVQEVFLRLVAQRCEPLQIKAWLYRSVRNEAIDQYRSESCRQKYERKKAVRECYYPSFAGDRLDAAAAAASLRSLCEEYREIIELRIWSGLTFEEASKVTGVCISTLFNRYRNALAELHKTMRDASRRNRTA